MKRYIIISLCFISLLNGMEREPCEWNAQDYANGNSFQEKSSLDFLEQYQIDLSNKDIVDAGCGTGNISKIMSQKAKSVHGFDASSNMINYARTTYGNVSNLTFEHCFAEDFTSSVKYDLITAFYCLHWVENKEAAFQKFYENLKTGGEFIGTISTTSNKPPISIEIFHDMLPGLQSIANFLKSMNVIEKIGRSEITDDVLSNALKNIGFTILSLKKQPKKHAFKDRDEVIAFQRPIIMSRPFVQYIPEIMREYIFNSFIDKYIEKLEKTDEGYFEPMDTTIIHCRK